MINLKYYNEQSNSICETIADYKVNYNNSISNDKVEEILDFILKSAIELNAEWYTFGFNKHFNDSEI